jgi:cytochrome c oxidase subunit 4
MAQHDDQKSHPHGDPHAAPHGGETLATLYAVYFILMGLLVVTVAMAYYLDSIHASTLSTFCAMFIAVVKASMVVLIFMHVRHSSKLTWVYVVAAFFWLAILLVYSAIDYAGRVEDPNHNITQRSVVAEVHAPVMESSEEIPSQDVPAITATPSDSAQPALAVPTDAAATAPTTDAAAPATAPVQ